MYDSRTDAPRLRHQHTYCRNEATARYHRSDTAAAIAEGLEEAREAAAEVERLVSA